MIVCIQFIFYQRLADDDLRGHRHRHELKIHVTEVPCAPRSVSCTVDIRSLLERKDATVDQDGDQTNCYRRQRAT